MMQGFLNKINSGNISFKTAPNLVILVACPKLFLLSEPVTISNCYLATVYMSDILYLLSCCLYQLSTRQKRV